MRRGENEQKKSSPKERAKGLVNIGRRYRRGLRGLDERCRMQLTQLKCKINEFAKFLKVYYMSAVYFSSDHDHKYHHTLTAFRYLPGFVRVLP